MPNINPLFEICKHFFWKDFTLKEIFYLKCGKLWYIVYTRTGICVFRIHSSVG